MTLLEKIEQNKEDLLNIRHQIHRHPETAFEEIETTKLIKKVLDDAGIENHPNGDSTGVIGLIHGAKRGLSLRSVQILMHFRSRKTRDFPFLLKFPANATPAATISTQPSSSVQQDY